MITKEVNIIKINGPIVPPKVYPKDCETSFQKVGRLLEGRVTIGVHHNKDCKWNYTLPLEMIVKAFLKKGSE